ncbi:MAG TPA: DUF4157 domain-containing protein [Allosphingosinicella sp.]
MRSLTLGEDELLRGVFGNMVDRSRVTLRAGPGRNPLARLALRQEMVWAMTYRSTIHFKQAHYSDDFSALDADARLLVHEMVHVWQYAKLGLPLFALRYGWNYIACDCNPEMTYRHSDARHFNQATLEGQASIVEQYFHGGAADPALKAKLAQTGFFGL